MKVSLIRCDRSGNPVRSIPDMAEELIANSQATADLYRRVGYVEPWVGYVAVVNGRGVGAAHLSVRPTRVGRRLHTSRWGRRKVSDTPRKRSGSRRNGASP